MSNLPDYVEDYIEERIKETQDAGLPFLSTGVRRAVTHFLEYLISHGWKSPEQVRKLINQATGKTLYGTSVPQSRQKGQDTREKVKE